MVTFTRVVIDDIQYNFYARAVKALHHFFEFTHLLPEISGTGVSAVWGKEANRAVSPIVRATSIPESFLIHMVVHGEELDGSYANVFQVFEDFRRSKTGIGSFLVIFDIRMPDREAFDVSFVDNCIAPRDIQETVILPIKARVDDH